MKKNLFISNFKQLPWALICSAVLFFAVQGMLSASEGFWRLNYFLSSLPTGDPIRFESLLRISKNDERKKVFIIGTSQTREGIDTAYLNKEFAKDDIVFYNLGVAGSAQPIDLYMLKDKIINKNPYAIVYMPYIESFYLEYSKDQFIYIDDFFHHRILPHFFKSLGIRETVMSYTKPILSALIGKTSIFYRHRNNIRDNIFTAMRLALGLEKRTEPVLYQNFDMKEEHYYENKLKEYGNNKYSSNKYSRLNNYLFKELINEFETKNIPVIIIDGPTHPLFKKVMRKEVGDEYVSHLRDQAKAQNVSFLSLDQMPYFPAEYFTDMVHFNAQGREVFTKFISQYLRQKLFKFDYQNLAVK
ncbi:MAG: hypothetical protein H6755_03590 [Candidatus Omnitrophica bacterium]|nr:hypothetical protein [Candidatus Omnitrophota bacterium]MCB9747471.1 hypothetical protein [Candidatus Omnitrophota bacterium]